VMDFEVNKTVSEGWRALKCSREACFGVDMLEELLWVKPSMSSLKALLTSLRQNSLLDTQPRSLLAGFLNHQDGAGLEPL
jgi:hypothetical protein